MNAFGIIGGVIVFSAGLWHFCMAAEGPSVPGRGVKMVQSEMMRNVLNYGAKGDGKTKDTAAIQAAVNAGGMVYFPPGTYLSGSIYLKSHSGLHLAPGAVLLMSPDMEDFNKADFVPWNYKTPSEYSQGKHLLIAVEKEDITICGGGTIHGNDMAFMNPDDPIKELMVGIYNVKPCGKPGQMLYFCLSRNITIRDVNIEHSSYWHCFLHGCTDVLISKVRIRGDHKVNTNDGIDIDCCKNVIVSECIIDTADDAIAIRGNSKRLQDRAQKCENILVSNCILNASYACAVRVGVGDGEIRNCILDNIIVPYAGTAILIQSRYSEASKGTSIQDISFSRWKVLDSKRPLKIVHETFKAKDPNRKPIEGLTFSDMDLCGKRTIFIQGNGVGPFGNFTFRNIAMKYAGCGTHPEVDPLTGWFGHFSTDSVFEIRNARDVELNNIKISLSGSGWNQVLNTQNVPGMLITHIYAPIPVMKTGNKTK